MISVRPLRTVVQLAHLGDPSVLEGLVGDFVVTAECERALRVVFDSLRGPRGSGFFLQGSFGSGKSHFLLVLARALCDPAVAERIAREAGCPPPGGESLVVPVSLVEHRAESRLEDAVSRAVAARVRQELDVRLWPSPTPEMLAEIQARIRKDYLRELREFLAGPDGKGLDEMSFLAAGPAPLALFIDRYRLPYRLRFERGEFWEEVSRALASRERPLRLVLLVDELSEFLRSKPDARSFNEDVRFLQFLGEAGERMGLWIIASLQEWIEETGEIRQETFNKIKDRYPARLVLSGAHLGELVRRRLAPKKPGAEEFLDRLYGQLRGAVPGFDAGKEEFRDLYPVHPATLKFLDDLRGLFSQHRGAVDFLNARIAGDPRRGIPGILGEPAGTLVTPDQILDHFEDRIRETVEYQPYLDVVHRYWRQEVDRIVPDPGERAVAMRALAVLILAALAPVERKYDVTRLTAMLAHRVTSIDARANAEHLRDILLRMSRDGAYLEHAAAQDILKDTFRVRLEADINVLISKKLKAAQKDALAEGRPAIRRLSRLLTDPALPLASWVDKGPAEVEVRWQNTRRRGYFLFGDPVELGQERFLELFLRLREEEPDFLFMIVAPWASEGAAEWIAQRLATLLDDAAGLAVRFWIPAAPGDLSPLVAALGRACLLERLRSDSGPMASSMAERLGAQLDSEGGRVREFVRDLYLRGAIVPARGQDSIQPREFGLLEFGGLLERVAGRSLDARFPAHQDVAPRNDLPILPRLDALLDSFFRTGIVPRTAQKMDQMLVEGYLMPLGVARQAKEGHVLHADPQRSPALRELLDSLGEAPVAVETLSRRFRKGPYGMALDPFRLLLLAGAYTGQLRLYGEKAAVRLDELRASTISRIRSVGRGEILGEKEQAELRALFFLDEKLRSRQPFSNLLQERIWEELKEFRRKTEGELAELEALLARKGEFPALEAAGFNAAGFRERSSRVARLLREVKVSYGSREGLEAFLRAAREEPFFEENYFELVDALGFLRGPVDGFLRACAYASRAEPVLAGASGAWADAARALEDLRAALAAGPPHRPENLPRRDAALEAFLGIYIPLYRSEHDRARSPARFQAHRALLETRPLRILKALSAVERLSAGNELVALHRKIDAVLRGECASLTVEALRLKPVCDCGFTPQAAADEKGIPAPAEILSEAERAVARVLGELGSPGCRERISAHVTALESVGQDAAARDLLALVDTAGRGISGEKEARALEDLLGKPLQRALRDAFGGRVLSVDRSLADLAERIAGRAFPRGKLLAAVEDWIRGDEGPGEDVLIRVVGAAQAGAPAGGAFDSPSAPALAAYIRERRPELAPQLASGMLSPEIPPLLLWAEEMEIPDDALSGLPGVELPEPPEREKLRALARELRGASPAAFAECARLAEAALLGAEDWAGISRRLGRAPGGKRSEELIQRSAVFPGLQCHLAREVAEGVLRGGPIPKLIESLAPDAFAAAAPLRELAALERARRNLEKAALPEDPRGFEDALRGDLGELVYRLAHLEGLCAERGVDLGAEPARSIAAKEIARWEGAFGQILAAGDRLDVLRIEALSTRWAVGILGALKPREALWILADGMRWDVWRYLREHFLPAVRGRYRIAGEAFTWARMPTTTETQLQWLEDPLARGELVAAERVVPREEYLRRRSAGGAGASAGMIVKLDFIDHKVHAFQESLYEFYREARIGAEIHLQGLLEALPEGSLAILFADHGFRESPAYQPSRRYELPRYTHGGDHFLEVLSPAAAIYKIAGG